MTDLNSDVTSDPYTAPDWRRSALLTVDVQRDVLDGQPLEIPGTSAALPRMRDLATAFRQVGHPIIHVVRIYRPDGTNVDVCRRQAVESGSRILAAGTEGVQLAVELLPDPSVTLETDLLLSGALQELGAHEAILYKPRWGAFFNTVLDAHLRALDATTVVVAGCNFPNCPRTSIYEASERDFRIVAVADAISGLDPRGESELRAIGVAVMPTDEILVNLGTVALRDERPDRPPTSASPFIPTAPTR